MSGVAHMFTSSPRTRARARARTENALRDRVEPRRREGITRGREIPFLAPRMPSRFLQWSLTAVCGLRSVNPAVPRHESATGRYPVAAHCLLFEGDSSAHSRISGIIRALYGYVGWRVSATEASDRILCPQRRSFVPRVPPYASCGCHLLFFGKRGVSLVSARICARVRVYRYERKRTA